MVRRTLYILIGSMSALLLILVGIAVFIFWPMVTSAHTSQTTVTPTVPATTTTPTPPSGTGIAKQLKQYAPAIKTQIAQGLKLTPAQLTTELRAGKTLSTVATAQGVSTTQLQTLVSTTLETNLKPAVVDGTITQKQLDKLSKRYAANPALLDKLLGGKGTKSVPTATPTVPAQ